MFYVTNELTAMFHTDLLNTLKWEKVISIESGSDAIYFIGDNFFET